MESLLRRGLRRIRRAFWLTRAERGHRRWQAERGDRGHRFDYPLGPGAIVVDAGGFDGRWAEKAIETWDCLVHVFEPVPEFSASIVTRLAGKRAIVHPYGLAGETGESEFVVAGDGSSALRRDGAKVRVRLRGVVEVFEELGLDRVDLMKINIEGGEYDLLDRMLDAGLMPRVGYLQVQFHDFVPRAYPRMRSIQRRMRATHELEWQYEYVWESWRRANHAPAPNRSGAH